MSASILGLGTVTPEYGINQLEAAEMAKQLCCQTADQERLLAMLYRRSGVAFRHTVILEPSVHPNSQTEQSPVSTQSIDNDFESNTALLDPSPVCLVPKTTAQSFYQPALSEADRGPTTDERMEFYERHVVDLGGRAAHQAMESSEQSIEGITHLITISCTGFCAPGLDVRLMHELGLNAETVRTHIGFMGCHGAINGLRVAKAYAEANPTACILMCAVELCSLHQQYGWSPDRIVSNALFADGAAAIVMKARSISVDSDDWKVISTASTIVPDTTELMSWRIRDHGFVMTLSARVPDIIRKELRPWLTRWLGQSGLSIEDIGSWAVHPGGPRILQATTEAAGLAASQLRVSRDVLSEYGNMSSPTVLFILQRLQQAHAARPCVMLAFGPGLTIEAALLR